MLRRSIRAMSSAMSSSAMSSSAMASSAMSSITKPLLDTREYRVVRLPNALEALLISDSNADKAAAAMDVRVGSLFDPPQWQGLAHFLEHMLFLGTSKYPAEDEYQSFLAKHGGMSNAFTADTHTCYFFQVSPEHFQGALDRFGQFFIDPLLTQSATDREVNAVNSEHSKNVQDDLWRQYQLMREVCFHKEHPSHHFSTGNKETLAAVPRQVLLDFHQAWYSANVSKVAVLGRESLDELEALVREVFEEVPNKDVVVPSGLEFGDAKFLHAIRHPANGTPTIYSPTGGVPHVNPSCLGQQLTVVPVKESRVVQFAWFLPEQTPLWQTKPARYLSHILGHEGPGSLTAVLKAKGIATDLVSGLGYDGAGVSLFKLDVHLTKESADRMAEGSGSLLSTLGELVSSYVRLAQISFSKSLWKEVEVVDNLAFTFRATTDPMTAVQTAVNALHYYPISEVLAGPARIFSFDEPEIRDHLGMLSLEKMIVSLVGKEFAADCHSTEQWYGTQYGLGPMHPSLKCAFEKVGKLSEEEFSNFAKSHELTMPKPNIFLPENLQLRPLSDAANQAKIPALLTRELFHKQDNLFAMPKASVAFAIYSPFVQEGLSSQIFADLFIQSFSEQFSKTAYAAEIGGLKYKLRSSAEGFSLSLSGYSDKLPVLLDMVISELANFQPNQQLFDLVKDRTVRQLQAQLQQKVPYSQALDLANQLLLSPYYSTAAKLAQVQAATMELMLDCIPANLFADARIEGLVEGNLDADEARAISQKLLTGLSIQNQPSSNEALSKAKVMQMNSDLFLQRSGVNAAETNGAVAVSVQTGWFSGHVSESDLPDLKTAALLSLTSQICGQKFFDDLRTKQQLGYIVHAASMIQERRAGLLFLVQSEVPTMEVKEKILTFINSLDSIIEGISDQDLGMYIQAVVTDLKEKPKNQSEEFQRHWGEIEKRRFDFERRDRLIPVVENLTKQELVEYVRERVVQAPKVVSAITGANEVDVAEVFPNQEIEAVRARAQTKWISSNSKPLQCGSDSMSKM